MHNLNATAKECEKCLDIEQQGTETCIRPNKNAPLASGIFDEQCNIIDFPLLLSVLEKWQQEGKISRLIRFYREVDQHRLFHQLSSGLLMWTLNEELSQGRSYNPIWLKGWALLKINLHGDVIYDIGDELLDLHQAAAFITLARDAPINKSVQTNELETGVSILLDPKWLNEKLGSQQNEIMHLLGQENVEASESITQLFPVDGHLADLVRQLLELRSTDFLYLMEVETITTNILLQSLKMLRAQSTEAGVIHKLRSQDIEKLNSVKDRLDSDYSNQFSLEELSRYAGINRRKLTEGFKGLFGSTVNEYLLRQRMINAADMLKQGLSATEVAHQVGYKEQSSFTRAFKRYYDILPRDFSG